MADHTKGPLTAMLKPPASYSDHGWRAMAMCGAKWMLGAPVSAAITVEDGLVVAGWDNEANAKRLAACWNAHDDLVTQLQRVYDALGGECFDWEPVRAALAKAGGTS